MEACKTCLALVRVSQGKDLTCLVVWEKVEESHCMAMMNTAWQPAPLLSGIAAFLSS